MVKGKNIIKKMNYILKGNIYLKELQKENI